MLDLDALDRGPSFIVDDEFLDEDTMRLMCFEALPQPAPTIAPCRPVQPSPIDVLRKATMSAVAAGDAAAIVRLIGTMRLRDAAKFVCMNEAVFRKFMRDRGMVRWRSVDKSKGGKIETFFTAKRR